MTDKRKPDTRDENPSDTTSIQVPLLAFHPASFLGHKIIGPRLEVNAFGIRRFIPANPCDLESLDPNAITQDDMVQLDGPSQIGVKTDNLTGRHVRNLSPAVQNDLKRYVTRPDPRVEGSMRRRSAGRKSNPIAERASIPDRISQSVRAKLDSIDNSIGGLFPEPGEFFKAPVHGGADTAVHLKGGGEGSPNEASAKMRAGGSSMEVGTGSAGVNAGSFETSSRPESNVHGGLSRNSLTTNLGPSTTMNPFPEYLWNASKFLIGVYAITRSMGKLRKAMNGG